MAEGAANVFDGYCQSILEGALATKPSNWIETANAAQIAAFIAGCVNVATATLAARQIAITAQAQQGTG